MQFDPQLIANLRRAHSQQWLQRWAVRIDAQLDGQAAGAAPARLAAAAALVQQDLGLPQPLAAWVGVDLTQTHDWLALALQAGAPWRDARGAALLQAGVGLGALWFMDPRLLPAAQMLPVRASLAATVAELMRQPMAAVYRSAAAADEAIRARCGPALQASLADSLAARRQPRAGADTAAPLRNLQRLVFERPSVDDEDETDGPPPEASEAALTFVQREQRLLLQAGVNDGVLARLCMAGDLVLGLGRCVRLLAGPLAQADAAGRADGLMEVIHGLAQDSQ